MPRYEVLPFNDSHMVGGYAVKHVETGRWVGRQLRLDKVAADILRFELEHAFELGRASEMVNG